MRPIISLVYARNENPKTKRENESFSRRFGNYRLIFLLSHTIILSSRRSRSGLFPLTFEIDKRETLGEKLNLKLVTVDGGKFVYCKRNINLAHVPRILYRVIICT